MYTFLLCAIAFVLYVALSRFIYLASGRILTKPTVTLHNAFIETLAVFHEIESVNQLPKPKTEAGKQALRKALTIADKIPQLNAFHPWRYFFRSLFDRENILRLLISVRSLATEAVRNGDGNVSNVMRLAACSSIFLFVSMMLSFTFLWPFVFLVYALVKSLPREFGPHVRAIREFLDIAETNPRIPVPEEPTEQ